MARKAKSDSNSVAKNLQAALKFCSVASRDIGLPYQSHFMFINRHVIAFDGIICAAHPVQEDLNSCPSASEFAAAIAHVTTDLAITESPDLDRLTIRAGSLHTVIPCIYRSEYPFYNPDAPIGPVDDGLAKALSAVGVLATEGGDDIMRASILMRTNTVVATDAHLLFEAWHGWNVPTLCIPKALVTALEKIDKKLTQFGFSANSITLYFEDGAWLRSQLFDIEKYPNADAIISDFPQDYESVPEGFYDALDVMLKQADENSIDLEQTYMELPSGNAKFEINLAPYFAPDFTRANIKYLLKTKWATHWNAAKREKLYFTAQGIRGVVMAQNNWRDLKRTRTPGEIIPPMQVEPAYETYKHGVIIPIDDEIPY